MPRRAEMITLSGMAVQPPGGDPRPPQRRKDTSNLRMPGMFGAPRMRYQVNQSRPYPHFGAPVHLLGQGMRATITNFPMRIMKLGNYDNDRPE